MNFVGSGVTADVYEYDENKVIKLFHENIDKRVIELEYEKSMHLDLFPFKTPKCYGKVQQGNRTGIIFDYIKGENCQDYYTRTDDISCLERFVKMQKQYLQIHTTELSSYKDQLFNYMNRQSKNLYKNLKRAALLPEGDNLLHGDFHLKNIIIDSDGEWNVIDFCSLCRGPWQYEVARTYTIYATDIPGMTYTKKEIEQRKVLCDFYLEHMGVTEEELKPYIPLIKDILRFE